MLDNYSFWSIVTIATVIVEWVILKKLLDNISDKKISNFKINIMLTTIIFICLSFIHLDIEPTYRIALGIIISMIFYKYNYCDYSTKYIVVPLLYWMVLLGIDAISMSVIVWANKLGTMDTLIHMNIYRLESIVVSKLILVIILSIFSKFKTNVDISKKDITYILIPIIANIASFLVIFKYIFEYKDAYILDNNEILLISLLLLLSNASLILSMRKIIVDNKIIAENNLIKEKMKIQYNHYINMQQDQMNIRQLHHDIKNHVSCIKGITSNNDATQYIDSIENELEKYANNYNTGNMILDTILREKCKLCKESKINFAVNINNFNRCKFIEVIDVCSIFSNILDNAIEACNKVNGLNKEINLKGTIIEDFYVIKIENTKVNKISMNNDVIKTDKKDKYLHGLGIKSVKSAVKKYNGEVAISYTNDVFIMKILIPL